MERDSERARAVLEALDGAFPGDGIVVAVAAVGSGSSGPAFTGSKNPLPLLVRFTASGQIAMLRVIASDEAPPW